MPDLRIADLAGRLGKHGARSAEHRVGLERRVARERADRDPVAVFAHVPEIVQPADVDERRGPRDAELHGRDQRVPAGEQLRVLVGAEELDRLLDRPRPVVLERGRDHAPALAAASTARTMLWYPVQRHRFPSSACLISPSDGLGFSFKSETVAITNPGVQ